MALPVFKFHIPVDFSIVFLNSNSCNINKPWISCPLTKKYMVCIFKTYLQYTAFMHFKLYVMPGYGRYLKHHIIPAKAGLKYV